MREEQHLLAVDVFPSNHFLCVISISLKPSTMCIPTTNKRKMFTQEKKEIKRRENDVSREKNIFS
jgi:hypothetical protein